jgi:diguanylate cyclase (GGDEF)-like protein
MGLEQWANKLGARATRKQEALSCVAVTAGEEPSGQATFTSASDAEALERVADLCQAQSRKSDVVGYVGGSQFVILAPDTDASGVQRLVNRLRGALAGALPGGMSSTATSTLRAGYCTVSNFASASLDPAELLRRAQTALQYAQLPGLDQQTFSFDEVPLS